MTAFKVATIVMLVSLMLDTGLKCNPRQLLQTLKNVGLLSQALVANFVVVPLVALGVLRFFGVAGPAAVGMLLMAMAPGAPFLAKSAGNKPGGSQGLAIALAFILPVISIITIPITATVILPAGADAQLPWGSFVIKLLILQLAPLLVGMVVANRIPTLGEKLTRPLGVLLLAAILVVLWHLVPTLVKAFVSVHGSNNVYAILAIVLLSIAVGWLSGGFEREYRRTLSLATGTRNVGLCTLVATVSFPKTLAGAAVITYFIVQFVISFCVRMYFHRTAKSSHGL